MRIGVLTSGGDAPGMNAAIRAVVRAGISYGHEVYGIKRGFNGLLNKEYISLGPRSVSETLGKGGTLLQTARSEFFKTQEGVEKAAQHARELGLTALVIIGGDGSFRGGLDLASHGINVVGVPATIDNDIGCTQYTIGFDTAINTVVDALDKLRDTGFSHERCNIVEVMGRSAGYIALNVCIAGGAETVVLPEKNFDINDDLIKIIMDNKARKKQHFLIIVAEGIGGVSEMGKMVQQATGIDTRVTILGHMQRGGAPSARDRIVASMMGARAVKLINEGKQQRVIVMQKGSVIDMDMTEALKIEKGIDQDMLELSKMMSL